MRNGPLAQPVEHWTFNPGVGGSNPPRLMHKTRLNSGFYFFHKCLDKHRILLDNKLK